MDNLIIKLKMPPRGSELRFECPICQKCFNSGKGLGGHKRAHMQTERKSQSQLKMELQITGAENAEPLGLGCPVCQQPFPSKKSLHGHMRKHPDRNWRGMIPPPIPQAVENGGSSLLVSDAVTQPEGNNSAAASDVLMMSGMAARRRRRRHGKAPMDIIPENDNDPISVANNLIALANGQPHLSEEDSQPKKKKLELSAVSCSAGNSVRVVLGGGYCFQEAGPIRGKKSSMLVRKGNSQRMLPVRAQKRFVCAICGRAFKTYQALGGHKSHHDKSAANNTSRQYPNCNEIIPREEALGHHMTRQRCSGPPPFTISGVPSCSGREENRNQITVFSFDLNELPPEATGTGGDGGW